MQCLLHGHPNITMWLRQWRSLSSLFSWCYLVGQVRLVSGLVEWVVIRSVPASPDLGPTVLASWVLHHVTFLVLGRQAGVSGHHRTGLVS